MDPVLKQRLIGVAVLWVLAFVLVPPLLKSSSDEPRSVGLDVPASEQSGGGTRTRSVELDGSSRADPEDTPTAPAGADGGDDEAPTGGSGDRGADAAASEPAPAGRDAAEEPGAAPDGAPAPAGDGREDGPAGSDAAGAGEGERRWAVQVGSFSERSNARGLRERLEERGYPVVITEFELEGQTLYRVRVGPEETEAAAEKRRAALEDELDLPARVVEHR